MDDKATPGHVLVQGQLHTKYAIQITGSIYFIDENDTGTNDASVIVAFDPTIGAVGDTIARVIFQFLPAATIYGYGVA